ncbi:MAG: hypothetical protein WBO32_03845, partial [Cyclobacteriaceae bacterium]
MKIPLKLKIVAILTIIFGVFTLIEVLVLLSKGHFKFDLGILNIFAGLGLLKLSNGWRKYLVFMFWVAGIFFVVILIMTLGSSAPLTFNVFGIPVANISQSVFLIFCIPFVCLAIWQYRVIT